MALKHPNEDVKHLNELLDSVDAIVWEARPDTFQFTYVNKVAEDLLGYPVDEWLERPTFWVDTLHPEDRDRAVRFCSGAITQRKDHEFDYRAIASDGRSVKLHDVVHVIIDESGEPTLLRGMMTEISRLPARADQRMGGHELLRSGPIVIDVLAFRAWRDGRLIHLTRTEYALLEMLLRHKEKVLTRQQILLAIWGIDFDGRSNVVDVYVKYLRDKIDAKGSPSLIETVRGVGYRLRDEG